MTVKKARQQSLIKHRLTTPKDQSPEVNTIVKDITIEEIQNEQNNDAKESPDESKATEGTITEKIGEHNCVTKTMAIEDVTFTEERKGRW